MLVQHLGKPTGNNAFLMLSKVAIIISLLLCNLSSTHYKSHDEQLAPSGLLGFPHGLRKDSLQV